MIWDIDTWVVIESGDIDFAGSQKYANYAMNILPTESAWQELPEVLIWPERRVPRN